MTKLVSITFQGPDGERLYPLFEKTGKPRSGDDKEPVKSSALFSVVHGRNGSGKSCFGRALLEDNAAITAHYLAPQEADRTLKAPLENVYVFNEDYIRENLMITEQNLGVIVLIGDQVRKNDDLTAVESEIEELEQTLEASERQQSLLKESHAAAKQSFDDAVRASNWRSARSRIDGSSRNVTTHVIDQVFKSATSIQSQPDSDKEKRRLEELILSVEGAADARQDFWTPRPSLIPFDVDELSRVLHTHMPPRKVSPEDSASMSALVRNLKTSRSELKELIALMDSTHEHCPACLQSIPDAHRADVLRIAADILEEEAADDRAATILGMRTTVPSIPELPAEVRIGDDLTKQYRTSFESWAASIRETNDKLSERADDPYKLIPFDASQICDAALAWDQAQNEVAAVVDAYNNDLNQLEARRSEARVLNDRLTALAVAGPAKNLQEARQRMDEAAASASRTEAGLLDLRQQAVRLKAEMRNATLAISTINDYLAVVFSDSRLRLQPADGQQPGYSVLVEGRPVPAGRLSTGERNALALAYFLVQISSDQSLAQAWAAEKLIVLDDPVSSFDLENRYGVISLILELANSCFKAGPKTKIAVFTHDLAIAYDLSKGAQLILDSCLPNQQVATLTLADRTLTPCSFDSVDVYRETLRRIYQAVAAFDPPEGSALDAVDRIPKIAPCELRLVFEAFVKFELDASIGAPTQAPELRAKFHDHGPGGEKFLRSFLPGFMNRVAHSGVSVHSMDFRLRPPLGEKELLGYMRSALVFIHTVSPLHIPVRVASGSSNQTAVSENLQRWQAVAFSIAGISAEPAESKDEGTSSAGPEPVALRRLGEGV